MNNQTTTEAWEKEFKDKFTNENGEVSDSSGEWISWLEVNPEIEVAGYIDFVKITIAKEKAKEKKAVLDNAIAEIESWMWLQEDIEEAVELGQGEVAGQRIAMNNSLNRVCQFLAHSQEDYRKLDTGWHSARNEYGKGKKS